MKSKQKPKQEASFKVSKEDAVLITAIARRAVMLADDNYDIMDADMDITACHANGTPLQLIKLLKADNFTFAHDVFGIRRHINRDTGQIENNFLPRCAAKV